MSATTTASARSRAGSGDSRRLPTDTHGQVRRLSRRAERGHWVGVVAPGSTAHELGALSGVDTLTHSERLTNARTRARTHTRTPARVYVISDPHTNKQRSCEGTRLSYPGARRRCGLSRRWLGGERARRTARRRQLPAC